jgi:asparagine synthase (glutamine-hydrolysing)
MCGIAGVFGRSDRETVGRMIARLHHRGPDDSHVVAGESFTLGAARLSIQDLAHGRQPLTDESGLIVAAQNGEIYNYPFLRERLLKHGHTLATHCDTEALPHLFEEAGPDLPAQLDGMFALAVWDGRTRSGLLARDRTGKKPLYLFHEADGTLWFASEIKALLEVPGFSRELDPAALHHFLGYKHVPHPLSIFRGITSLPPACRLRWQPGAPAVIEPYWRPNWAARPDLESQDEESSADRLLELLRAGVKKRLIADVPVGFFLSGGIDSSLTVALAAEVSPQTVKTFTLTYAHEAATSGKQADAHWARWTARRFGTEHHEEIVHFSDFPSNLRRILGHFDEPFAGVVSTFFLSQLIAKHVKVAVSGDGADELFGSYLSHRMGAALGQSPQTTATAEFDPAKLARLRSTPDWRWRSQLLVFSDEEKHALYAPDFRGLIGSLRTDEHLRDTAFSDLTAVDPLNRILEAEFKTFFPDQVLAFTDRLSMAHSLEVRTAFLDTAVVEFSAALPGRLKIKDGVTKYLLKKAAARYFPSEMIHRPKEGFLMPITQWLLRDLQPYVRDVLAPSRVGRAGVFDPARVTALIDRLYATPAADYRQVNQVYALLVFHEWHDLYLA